MRWATRAGIHIDRAACAWLIRRFVDPQAQFVFVADRGDVPADATGFDMRGVELSHHTSADGAVDCSFETILRRHDLSDPVLWRIAQIVHEADLDDERYDAPEAAGLDVVLRGLSMIGDDTRVLELTGPIFDGLYEYHRRAMLLGREPAAAGSHPTALWWLGSAHFPRRRRFERGKFVERPATTPAPTEAAA